MRIDARRSGGFVALENGAMMPKRFVAECERDGLALRLEVEIVSRTGHSRLVRLEATADGGGEITAALPTPAQLLREATASAASWMVFDAEIEGGGRRGAAASLDEAQAAEGDQLRRNPTRRRDARAANLKTAARAFQESGGSIAAIMDALHVEKTTAYRLRDDARTAGLLPQKVEAS